MQVKTIRYELLTNLGNYENEKIIVEVGLQEGDTAVDAIEWARTLAYLNAQTPAEHDAKQLSARRARWDRERKGEISIVPPLSTSTSSELPEDVPF